MAEIFVNIDQIKEHIDVGAIKYESLRPYFISAEEKFLIPYIGQAQINEIKSNPTAANIKALLPFVRKTMAHFVLLCAAPDLDINLSETGFTTAANSNLVPASAQRVERFVKNQKELGFTGLNSLLSYLNSNTVSYPLYAASDEFKRYDQLILNSMNIYQDCVDIKHSWLLYSKLVPKIKDVEFLKIIPIISQDYFSGLISRRKSQTLTISDKEILPLIYRAIANYVHADFSNIDIDDETLNEFSFAKSRQRDSHYSRMAEHFISEVRKKLQNNPQLNYPEYFNSAQYNPDTSMEKYTNSQDNGAYFFGL